MSTGGVIWGYVLYGFSENDRDFANEPGVPNVGVSLHDCFDGEVSVMIADNVGFHSFTGLAGRGYDINVPASLLPMGYEFVDCVAVPQQRSPDIAFRSCFSFLFGLIATAINF